MRLRLMACGLIKMILNGIILLNFFNSILYDTEKPKLLRKVITYTLVQQNKDKLQLGIGYSRYCSNELTCKKLQI